MSTMLSTTGGGGRADLPARSAVTSGQHLPTDEIFSPRGKGDAAQGFLFSRLLAGKLAESRRADSGTERSAVRDDPRREQVDPGHMDDDPVTTRSETNGPTNQAQGTEPGEQATENGRLSWSGRALDSAGAFPPWGGLSGMLQIAGEAGSGNGMIPDLTVSGGIPAEFRSRLSAEIAANYSVRNGSQLVTFKFEAEHLGQIDVRLQAKADHLTIRLLVASRESQAALRENIKELGEAIQKRTGRFQQVEVRVNLKGGEDLGQESTEEDSGQSPEGDTRDESGADPDNAGDSDNRDPSEIKMEPDDRAQGG